MTYIVDKDPIGVQAPGSLGAVAPAALPVQIQPSPQDAALALCPLLRRSFSTLMLSSSLSPSSSVLPPQASSRGPCMLARATSKPSSMPLKMLYPAHVSFTRTSPIRLSSNSSSRTLLWPSLSRTHLVGPSEKKMMQNCSLHLSPAACDSSGQPG